MSKKVIIIGASGHGKVIADIVRCCGDEVKGFLDDNSNLPDRVFDIPLLGSVACFPDFPDATFVIGIGNGTVRREIAEKMQGVQWYTAIHPTAVISDFDTTIGEGSVVMANAVVNPGTNIGRHCIVNTSAVVDHDNRIGAYAHISVGARLAGTVSIGEGCWVGIGAVVSNNVSICPGCMIGAGAVVVRNITEPGTYVGVPARKKK